MKKQILLVFIVPVFIFSSCKVIQLSSLHTDGVLSRKLPALQVINTMNTTPPAPTYGGGYGGGYGRMSGLYSGYGGGYNMYFNSDADVLYNRYIKDNITNLMDDRYGYAEFRTIVGHSGYCGWGWYALSTVTCMIPNLLGMPLMEASTDLEVELDILNSERKIIGRYIGKGYGKVPIALYYGYNMMSATRASSIDALKMALKSINMQIEKEADMLSNKLIEAGKIK